jgi:hypothetical protein
VVTIKSIELWDVTPCSPIEVHISVEHCLHSVFFVFYSCWLFGLLLGGVNGDSSFPRSVEFIDIVS